jgi:hypothetical protein
VANTHVAMQILRTVVPLSIGIALSSPTFDACMTLLDITDRLSKIGVVRLASCGLLPVT